MRDLLMASIVVAFLTYASTGIYEVKPEESGVAFVFGGIANPYVPSGIHWNFPAPIGRQVTMPTRLTQVMQVGYDSDQPYRYSQSRSEALWFTGGTSVVECQLDIQYSISKLNRFILSHEEPEAYMRLIAERAVTRFFAGLHVDDILTTERQSLVRDVAEVLQSGLDDYDMGIQVQDVSIVHLAPPASGGVSNAFREVQTTRSERERQIEKALSGAANIRFNTEAEAETIRSESKADRYTRVQRARAESKAFSALVKAQATAPEITRIRLYRDIVPDALQKATLYVVPNEQNTNVTVGDR